ncbi:hypothetical protein BJ165DRAFT_1402820 [Panaeolus papilionaceus]|nr:hypothetical protein BJ165DRAFT_1402820 [Panaeolus papilionaceus]
MTITSQSAYSSRHSSRIIDFLRPQGAFWGFYTALFIAALPQDGTSTSTFSRWIMSHYESCCRLLRNFVFEVEASKKPHKGILYPVKWDNMAHILLMTAMVWLGDVLVIYRTYIVWNRSTQAVALPMIVNKAYMVVNTLSIYGFSHPNRIGRKRAIAWYQAVFPLVFAQNVITTSLLMYKIYSTHRTSCKNSTANATPGAMALGSLLWMLIETAMLYTLQLLVMIVLGALRHPAKAIASVLLVPTLGIVFVLLSVRVHFSSTPTMDNWSTPSKVPNVLRDSVLGNDAAAAPPPSTGIQRPVTPPSLDGDIDMDILILRRHDSNDSHGEEATPESERSNATRSYIRHALRNQDRAHLRNRQTKQPIPSSMSRDSY